MPIRGTGFQDLRLPQTTTPTQKALGQASFLQQVEIEVGPTAVPELRGGYGDER